MAIIMKTFIRILSIVLIAMIVPMSVVTGSTTNNTVTVKKVPKNPMDYGKGGYRTPSSAIYCIVDLENGIQPIDTSEVESYEVWDYDDTTLITSFGDEFDFIVYILHDHPQCIIKLCTPDYMYIGYVDSSESL